MKTPLIFVFLILVLNVTAQVASIPRDTIKVEDVEKQHATKPAFKYYYPVTHGMNFMILGYWENHKGTVYAFSQDELNEIKEFINYNEFVEYLTPSNSDLVQYIIIPLTDRNYNAIKPK